MAKHNYAFQQEKENIVKAVGRNLDVSPKEAIEICTYVRGRPLAQAKGLLQESIDMIKPVPMRRFTNGLGHKPGMGPGRYYVKACSQILKVIKSAESNAKNKGYNTADLKVTHIAMQIGPKTWHYGRKKRSISKNSHIEVVLEEIKGLAEKKAGNKSKSAAKPKQQAGAAGKKEQPANKDSK